MSAGHNHHNDKGIKQIRNAFLLNFFFTLFEIAGGIWTNSMAILSDALHDLGDSISLGLAWYLEKVSHRKRDKTYSFGYRRFSLLGALINAMVLLAGSVIIIGESIPRLLSPEQPDARGMMYIAIIGVLVNGAAALQLRGGRSLNQKVLTWHLLEDVLGWIAVLIVSIVLQYKDWPILDPLLSIIILAYVLFNVIRYLIKTIRIFMQSVPKELDMDSIESSLGAIPNVLSVSDLRIWTLDGEKHVVDIHLNISEKLTVPEMMDLKRSVRGILDKANVRYATVELVFPHEIQHHR